MSSSFLYKMFHGFICVCMHVTPTQRWGACASLPLRQELACSFWPVFIDGTLP